MEESLQKYYVNLSDRERLYRPTKMLWLLQGRATFAADNQQPAQSIEKGDPQAVLEYYPEAYLGSLSWGAVPLNPQNASEWAIHFWSTFCSALLT